MRAAGLAAAVALVAPSAAAEAGGGPEPAAATTARPAAVGATAGPGAPGGLGGGLPASADRCARGPIRVALQPTAAGLGAAGWLELVMAPSPFGVTVSPEGRYRYDITLRVERLRRRPGLAYVAWATTPELDRVENLGVLGEDGLVSARLEWNKFLVLVTAEEVAEGERWRGPVLLTGISPSGLMHTMRGHGIFEAHGIGC